MSSIGVLLKPLRVKKRNHSREKKRKQTDSRQQTGKTQKENAGGASARPGFPGAAGARPFCPSSRQDDRFKTATVRSQRFVPCIKLSPCSHAFQQFTKYVSLFHLCPLRLPVSVNKHRDRDLKSICQRPHVIKGQTTFTTEDPADERFFAYLIFKIGL